VRHFNAHYPHNTINSERQVQPQQQQQQQQLQLNRDITVQQQKQNLDTLIQDKTVIVVYANNCSNNVVPEHKKSSQSGKNPIQYGNGSNLNKIMAEIYTIEDKCCRDDGDDSNDDDNNNSGDDNANSDIEDNKNKGGSIKDDSNSTTVNNNNNNNKSVFFFRKSICSGRHTSSNSSSSSSSKRNTCKIPKTRHITLEEYRDFMRHGNKHHQFIYVNAWLLQQQQQQQQQIKSNLIQ
jgi:hypothetical protein